MRLAGGLEYNMAQHHSPKITTSNLILYLDAGNRESYPGSGTSWRGLQSGYNGTLVGSPTYNPSRLGYLTFSGTSQYATIASNSVFAFGTGNFTIDCWVNYNSLAPTISSIMNATTSTNTAASNLWWFGYYNTIAGITFGQHITGATSYAVWTPQLSTWYHTVARRTSGAMSFYINGVSLAVTNPSAHSAVSWSQVGLSVAMVASPYYLNGSVASCKIYNRSLSNDEITQNFNAHRGRYGV